MKIKTQIYPKTQRLATNGKLAVLTEKLDGSNLVFYKFEDELYICQRNYIYKFSEIDNSPEDRPTYSGLYGWLKDNGETLLSELQPNAAICGEWIGDGVIKYGDALDGVRFQMFAKGNVYALHQLSKLNYQTEFFKWSFVSQELPKFISCVPVAYSLDEIPSPKELDTLYENYCEEVGRDVEGFVMNTGGEIKKYVRMKKGKKSRHFSWEDGVKNFAN